MWCLLATFIPHMTVQFLVQACADEWSRQFPASTSALLQAVEMAAAAERPRPRPRSACPVTGKEVCRRPRSALTRAPSTEPSVRPMSAGPSHTCTEPSLRAMPASSGKHGLAHAQRPSAEPSLRPASAPMSAAAGFSFTQPRCRPVSANILRCNTGEAQQPFTEPSLRPRSAPNGRLCTEPWPAAPSDHSTAGAQPLLTELSLRPLSASISLASREPNLEPLLASAADARTKPSLSYMPGPIGQPSTAATPPLLTELSLRPILAGTGQHNTGAQQPCYAELPNRPTSAGQHSSAEAHLAVLEPSPRPMGAPIGRHSTVESQQPPTPQVQAGCQGPAGAEQPVSRCQPSTGTECVDAAAACGRKSQASVFLHSATACAASIEVTHLHQDQLGTGQRAKAAPKALSPEHKSQNDATGGKLPIEGITHVTDQAAAGQNSASGRGQGSASAAAYIHHPVAGCQSASMPGHSNVSTAGLSAFLPARSAAVGARPASMSVPGHASIGMSEASTSIPPSSTACVAGLPRSLAPSSLFRPSASPSMRPSMWQSLHSLPAGTARPLQSPFAAVSGTSFGAATFPGAYGQSQLHPPSSQVPSGQSQQRPQTFQAPHRQLHTHSQLQTHPCQPQAQLRDMGNVVALQAGATPAPQPTSGPPVCRQQPKGLFMQSQVCLMESPPAAAEPVSSRSRPQSASSPADASRAIPGTAPCTLGMTSARWAAVHM